MSDKLRDAIDGIQGWTVSGDYIRDQDGEQLLYNLSSYGGGFMEFVLEAIREKVEQSSPMERWVSDA